METFNPACELTFRGAVGHASAAQPAPPLPRTATDQNPDAVARLQQEWRAVRLAIFQAAQKSPEAAAAFARVAEEYGHLCHSPEWEAFLL